MPLALLLTLLSQAPEPTVIAVLDLRIVGNVDPAQVAGLSALIASETATASHRSVVSGSDLMAMINVEQQKQLLGCSDAICLAEIGGALGARFLVASEISRFGDEWLLTLSLLDNHAQKSLQRSTVRADDDRELLDATQKAVRELVAALPVDGAPPAEPTALVAEARSPLPFYLATGGAALVAVLGGALYGQAWSRNGDPMTEGDANAYKGRASTGGALLSLGVLGAGVCVVLHFEDVL